MNHVAIFLMYFLGDWAGAHWASACSANRAKPAASWSLLYHLIHGSAVVFIVHDPWCILSLAAGGALGCLFAVRHKRRRASEKVFVHPMAKISPDDEGFLRCNN